MEIKFKPIGFVKNNEKRHAGGWRDILSDLAINEEYKEALEGLKDYSHLIVIYWMHEIKSIEMKTTPQGKVGIVPKVGVFATRCPHRPNPIGISIVEILNIKDNIIAVKGLDAVKDTPILDIKPYTLQYDAVKSAKYPEWVDKLDY